MPDNATLNFTTHFDRNWKAKAGQKISRLRTRCMVKTGCTGERETHNQHGTVDDVETTGERYKKVVLTDLETDLISIFPQEFQIATGESVWDPIGLLPTVALNGKVVMEHTRTFNKRCDKVIVAALGGNRQSGKNGLTANALPSAQKIAKDYVESGAPADSSLTVTKLLEGISRMERNEVYGQDQMEAGIRLHIAASSKMLKALKLDANNKDGSRLFSKDFLPPVLNENGQIKEFLGLDFVRTELLDFDPADATVQFAYLWTTDGLQFDLWQDQKVSIDRRPDLSNATQFLSQYKLGASRLEDLRVIQIACKVG